MSPRYPTCQCKWKVVLSQPPPEIISNNDDQLFGDIFSYWVLIKIQKWLFRVALAISYLVERRKCLWRHIRACGKADQQHGEHNQNHNHKRQRQKQRPRPRQRQRQRACGKEDQEHGGHSHNHNHHLQNHYLIISPPHHDHHHGVVLTQNDTISALGD